MWVKEIDLFLRIYIEIDFESIMKWQGCSREFRGSIWS